MNGRGDCAAVKVRSGGGWEKTKRTEGKNREPSEKSSSGKGV